MPSVGLRGVKHTASEFQSSGNVFSEVMTRALLSSSLLDKSGFGGCQRTVHTKNPANSTVWRRTLGLMVQASWFHWKWMLMLMLLHAKTTTLSPLWQQFAEDIFLVQLDYPCPQGELHKDMLRSVWCWGTLGPAKNSDFNLNEHFGDNLKCQW